MKSTVNWVYGAKSPDIAESVESAIFAAHQYRNKLCELELAKRERHELLLQRLAPRYVSACDAVSDCEKKLAEAREAIQRERTKQRKKTPVGVDHWKNQATKSIAKLKELRAARKAAKQSAYGDANVKAAMKENATQHKSERTEAKKNSGLYWGTEAIVRMACGSFPSGAPPRFKRYDGEGQLAVQLQGGLDCDDAERFNTLCYFGERTGKTTECFIRIASDGGRPVFAKVPVIMHRPLPEGRIKWAYLERRKIASHVRWSIRMNIDVQADVARDSSTWCALHVGWVMQANGLRAAMWQGSDGKRGSIVLPLTHCRDYEKLDRLRSERDTALNEAKDYLAAYLAGCEDLPEWMNDLKPHVRKWRSPRRMAHFVLRWRRDELIGDSESQAAFDGLDQWRKKDKHRWQHSRRLNVRISRRRTHVYRNIAKQLSDRYGVLFVGRIDAKILTENSTPEQTERDNVIAHRHAKWAAVSDLVRMMEEKFPLHSINVDTKNLTKECHQCGEVVPVNRRKVQCSSCGKTWDVDENAIANTIARGKAAKERGELLELVQRQRDKELKAVEKLAKRQSANRAARKRV